MSVRVCRGAQAGVSSESSLGGRRALARDPRARWRCGKLSAAVVLSAVAGLLAPAPADAARPLVTAVIDPSAYTGSDAHVAFSRVRAAGGTAVVLVLAWRAVAPAPGALRPPTGFDPSDPADPQYRWAPFDAEVEEAVAHGLQPLISVTLMPRWAADQTIPFHGVGRPNLQALTDFVHAAATRYDGTFEGLSRVRLWKVWNEPNARREINPQFVDGSLVSPAYYRRMVNAFASAAHGVAADNVVVAGGLAPFGHTSPDIQVIAPLRFMREALCVSAGGRPTCHATMTFDVWSVHPYTAGGPTHVPYDSNDVSLGNLGEVTALLQAAVRAGHVVSRAPPRFWVTEFAWDTSPPDTGAVPAVLAGRWVAEALYRMWSAGVSLVAWFRLRDDPLRGPNASPYQCGLYYYGGTRLAGDRPKPLLAAFRFPFYASARKGSVFVWGRTPTNGPAVIVVQQSVAGRWRAVARLRADVAGIFQATFADRELTPLRAQVVGSGVLAPTFSPRPTRDLRVQPFGAH